MNIQKQTLDDSMINIVMTLEPDDYKKLFDQKLQSASSKAALKGFRKGKVPANVIKKMYGESIFVEMMDELFNKAFNDYTSSNNIKYIVQPILAEGFEKFTLDFNNTQKSYTLAYTIAELPQFEVSGVSENDEYQSFSPIIEEDVVETELLNIQKKYGKMEEQNSIKGGEMLTIFSQEMKDGQIVEGG
ncbi:MAG: trigger factor, partial [Bacteroidota bacterium]